MRFKEIYLLLGFMSFIVSCSEYAKDHYPTRSAAEADKLFDRGWLPEFIPPSSRDIVTENDLDTNTSLGEFFFSPGDEDDFLSRLQGQKDLLKEYSKFSFTRDETTWLFEVNFEKGHCRYSMNYKSK
jgi:hypothetical protein